MSDERPRSLAARWRATYGASPLHLLLHLAAIALIAWALAQSFDDRYSAAYGNLAIWLVAGAIINDFVAIPLYVGVDRLARAAWGRIRPAGSGGRGTHDGAAPPDGEAAAGARPTATADGAPVRVPFGHGHVRVPVVMSLALLVVYFPNITDKAPIGHRLATGLPEQPDYASRWLAITAVLLGASAALYGVRVLLARRRAAADPGA